MNFKRNNQKTVAPPGVLKGALILAIVLPLLGPLAARAQSAMIQMGSLRGLESKAQNVTNVNLDQNMLQLALTFMSHDNVAARNLVKQLKGIYIRDFEFAKEGMYSQSDINRILAQVHAHPWERIVSQRIKKGEGESDDIYIMQSGKNIRGLLILSAEPKELVVVNIVGSIDMNDLSHLEGKFGIPKMNLNPSTRVKP